MKKVYGEVGTKFENVVIECAFTIWGERPDVGDILSHAEEWIAEHLKDDVPDVEVHRVTVKD